MLRVRRRRACLCVLLSLLVALTCLFVYFKAKRVYFALKSKFYDYGIMPCGLRTVPFMQYVSSDTMHFVWETNCEFEEVAFRWGSTKAALSEGPVVVETLVLDHTHILHRAKVKGLAGPRRIFYEVHLDRRPAYEASFFFYGTRYIPGQQARFAVVADNQDGPSRFARILDQIRSNEPHVILHGGDMVQRGSQLADWQAHFFGPLSSQQISHAYPLMIAQGNHDQLPNRVMSAYFAPEASRCAQSVAGARIIVLNTEEESNEQVRWLKDELQSSVSREASFRIVLMHVPPFVEFWNLKHWWQRNEYTWPMYARKKLLPVMEAHNVDLLLTGHQHNYQRGLYNGIVHVITGGGGGDLDVERVEDHHFYSKTELQHHYLLLTVTDRLIRGKAMSIDGHEIDSFEIARRRVSL